jgi:hypothetical protein
MLVAILVIVCVIGAAILLGPQVSKPKPDPTPTPLPKNNPPIACAPFLIGGVTSNTVFIGDAVKLDLRHRVHGCDANGAATDETGAYDPEGDVVEYSATCTGPSPDGLSVIPYTVYNEHGVQIDSAWIKNGDPKGFALAPAGPGKPIEAQALVTFFIGRRDSSTPYPFAAKGCTPEPKDYVCPKCYKKATLAVQQTPRCSECGTLMVIAMPVDGTKLGECIFSYTVRDTKGATATAAMAFTVYKNCKA